MRIAVAVDNNEIAGHFGLCAAYHVFEVENGTVINEETHKNPGHAPGVTPPTFVAGLKVDAAIGGTVSQGAVDVMNQGGVDVILGVSGDPRQAALDYAAGKLKTDESAIKPCAGC